MSRLATGFFMSIALVGCEARVEDVAIAVPPKFTCAAAQVLLQAPDSLPVLDLDFGLSDSEFREHAAALLEYDTCRHQQVAICLPRPLVVEGSVITKVRSRLQFHCELDIAKHENQASVLVNRAGMILCEGEVVQFDQIRECYSQSFDYVIEDDYPLVALDLDWSGANRSLIGEIISSLAEEHWRVLSEYAGRRRGKPICSMGEADVHKFIGPFEVVLLDRPIPPPPPVTRINARTIFIQKFDQIEESLNQ